MKEYAVIYERGDGIRYENWSAYLPDLPGCISTGETFEEVQKNIQEAVELHLSGMHEDGIPIPEPTSVAGKVLVAA